MNFFAAFVIEHNGYALESIYVSKGISEEERDMIFQDSYVDWKDKSVYWFGDSRGAFDTNKFLISTRFLGFSFRHEVDGVEYAEICFESGVPHNVMFVKKPPSNVMNQVVASLPPSGPTLVPGDACLYFVCAKSESESFTGIVIRCGRRYRSIYVSKGIRKEDRDVIFEGVTIDWSQETTAYWYTRSCGDSDLDHFLVSAIFMGFGFESETDRRRYDTRHSGPPQQIMLVKNSAN